MVLRTLVIKHRSMDLLTTITPFDEDSQYWYVVETRGKNMITSYALESLTLAFWEKNKKYFLVISIYSFTVITYTRNAQY
jgi:hypothetical protein